MLTLPNILAGIILVALTAYVLFAGADFGGGVWDLLASGLRKRAQRELVQSAIGPVWEANHVWLILAIVLLFTCFPAAFARIAIMLHIPLTLMLIGIVLRGSAFVFQSYGGGGGRVFATASLVTPMLLGISVGAVASGNVGRGTGDGFSASYIAPWLTPFGIAVGLFALACFAFLARRIGHGRSRGFRSLLELGKTRAGKGPGRGIGRHPFVAAWRDRSEERRVGKECRSRWS